MLSKSPKFVWQAYQTTFHDIGIYYLVTAPLIYPAAVDERSLDMSFSSANGGGDHRPLVVGKSTTLQVYMPNGENKIIKYVSGTNIQTICDLVVRKLGHGERPYRKSYALYLRHTDPSKVSAAPACLSIEAG